ncbi:MAG: hypothetical protein JRF72_06225 [Deltaproteobacteria bacterium]|jgi:hypothetical protein|nr:hypothetical protein [Deltaproteobacteria bacterium]
MSGLTKLGLIFLLAGVLVVGYQGISTLMGANRMADDIVWEKLSLADVFDGLDSEFFEDSSFFGMGDILKFLADAPLFLWLFGLAFFCFLIGAFGPGR